MRETENELQSNCCFAPFNEDHGICTECGEHAEGVFELECGAFSDDAYSEEYWTTKIRG
jgi:predicted amidophosphoribosyltransferase